MKASQQPAGNDRIGGKRTRQKQNNNIPSSCSLPASELPAESRQSRDQSGQRLYGSNPTVSHPLARAKLRDKKSLKGYSQHVQDTVSLRNMIDSSIKHLKARSHSPMCSCHTPQHVSTLTGGVCAVLRPREYCLSVNL